MMLTATFRDMNRNSGLKRHRTHTQLVYHPEPVQRIEEVKTLDEIKRIDTVEGVKAYIFNGIKSGAKVDTLDTGSAIYTALETQFDKVHDQHKNRKGELYTRNDGDEFKPTVSRFVALWKLAQETNISVDLDGAFIWVSGDTKPIKETLKALGMRFSGPRQAWYYTNKQRYR